MAKFIIKETRIKGKVKISEQKTPLPVIAASLLTEGKTLIEEVPCLSDVKQCELMKVLGVKGKIM